MEYWTNSKKYILQNMAGTTYPSDCSIIISKVFLHLTIYMCYLCLYMTFDCILISNYNKYSIFVLILKFILIFYTYENLLKYPLIILHKYIKQRKSIEIHKRNTKFTYKGKLTRMTVDIYKKPWKPENLETMYSKS